MLSQELCAAHLLHGRERSWCSGEHAEGVRGSGWWCWMCRCWLVLPVVSLSAKCWTPLGPVWRSAVGGDDGADCAQLKSMSSILNIRVLHVPGVWGQWRSTLLVVVCRTFCRIVICVNACRSSRLPLLSLTGRGPEHLVSFVGERRKKVWAIWLVLLSLFHWRPRFTWCQQSYLSAEHQFLHWHCGRIRTKKGGGREPHNGIIKVSSAEVPNGTVVLLATHPCGSQKETKQ